MPSNEKVIRIILRLQDEASAGFEKSANSLKKIGDSLTSVGQKMTAGVTLPLVGMGVAMMKTFADFESVMAEIEARTGSTAEEMKKMQEFAIEMGRTTAFSATEAAQALLELTSSGSSAAEAMKQLPAVLDLAAAGALDLGRAADGVTDILAQFQLEAEQSAMVANQLAKAAGASSATVEDLLQAFGNAGPVMAQFGLSVEESAAALAVLAENGVKGAEAGTMLKSMLMNMSQDTLVVKGAWEKLGISMYDAQGNMRDIDDIFKDINKAMQGMSTEEQNKLTQKLAGSYGIVAFNALRASNGISDMQAAMAGAAGASEVADARMNTLAGAFDSLMGSIETLGIVLGGLAAGPLTDLIKWLTEVVNVVTAWVQANPELAQFVMIVLAIIAAIGPLLIIVGQLISAFAAVQAFMIGFPAIAATFAGAIAFILSPIGLFLAAIVLLAAAIMGNWFGIRDAIVAGAAAIIGAVQGLVWGIINLVGQIIEAFKKLPLAWMQIIAAASTSFRQLGVIIWEGIKAGLVKAGAAIVDFVNTAKNLATGFFEMGQAIINGLINGIKSKAVELIAYVFGLSKEMTAAIKSALGISSPSKVMMELGKQTAAGFQAGMKNAGGLEMGSPSVGGRSLTSNVAGRPALAGAGGGGGNVIIHNLNVPPGTTEQQIDHIMKEIGKKTKRKSGGLLGNGR